MRPWSDRGSTSHLWRTNPLHFVREWIQSCLLQSTHGLLKKIFYRYHFFNLNFTKNILVILILYLLKYYFNILCQSQILLPNSFVMSSKSF